jgi:hypothetical protein
MVIRLLERYDISYKPEDTAKSTVATIELQKLVKDDLSILSSYLDAWGAERIDSDDWSVKDYSFSSVPISDIYHLKGMTIKIDVNSNRKEWLIQRAGSKKASKQTVPKNVEVYVSIYGDGSRLMREYLRKNVFGPKNRKVIDSRNPKSRII